MALVVSLGVAHVAPATATTELPPLAPVTSTSLVGPGVGSIASDGRSVWVADAGGVARVDAATGDVVLRVSVGANGGVALAGDKVWISSYTHGVVAPINPVTGTVDDSRRASVPEPSGMALGSGALWVTSPRLGTVTRVNGATGAIEATIPLEAEGPIASGFNDVWVASTTSGGLARIDPATDAVETVDIGLAAGDAVTALSVGNGALWVGTLKADLKRYDPTTGDVATITAAAIPGLDLEPIGGIAVSSSAVWITGTAYTGKPEDWVSNPGTLVRIDASRMTVTDAWTLDAPGASGAVLAGGRLWMEVGSFDLQAVAAPDAPPAQTPLSVGALAEPFTFEPEIDYVHGADGVGVPLDVYAPADASKAPVVILAPGGPGMFGQREYLTGLAAALAERDMLVFVVDYRSYATGDTETDARHDMACAIGWGRDNAGRFGGDASRVVAVGHSYGGYLLLRALLDGPGVTSCDGRPAEPDAYVVLGKVQADAPVPEHATTKVPVTLVIGTLDDEFPLAQGFHDALVAAGYHATVITAPGVDHFAIIDTRPDVPTVDAIAAIARP
jgi:acetyl esterase/lipase